MTDVILEVTPVGSDTAEEFVLDYEDLRRPEAYLVCVSIAANSERRVLLEYKQVAN